MHAGRVRHGRGINATAAISGLPLGKSDRPAHARTRQRPQLFRNNCECRLPWYLFAATAAVVVAVAAAAAAAPSLAATEAATSAPRDASTITDWWVVSITSGARLKPLEQYQPVVNAKVPSLRAIVVESSTDADMPAVATIAAEIARSVRSPPYTLAGVKDGGVKKPRWLLPSPYSLVAYVRSVGAIQSPVGQVPDPAAA